MASHSDHSSHSSHSSHTNHGNHSSHSDHSNHNSHSVHSVHAVHANTLNPVCTTVGNGSIATNVNAKATRDIWNELRGKINKVKNQWDLPNMGTTLADDAEVVASHWNDIRNNIATIPYKTNENIGIASSNSNKLSQIGYGYDDVVGILNSKSCSSVCPSVCTSVHSDHTNHSSHGSHSDHNSHSSHSSHNNHGNHSSHSDHSNHNSHNSHSSHSDHSSHSSHASHSSHSDHSNSCDCVGDTCYCENRTCSRGGCTTNVCQE